MTPLIPMGHNHEHEPKHGLNYASHPVVTVSLEPLRLASLTGWPPCGSGAPIPIPSAVSSRPRVCSTDEVNSRCFGSLVLLLWMHSVCPEAQT